MQPNSFPDRGWDVQDEAIWREVKDDLVRYATVLLGPIDAEDVVSTVVIRVLERGRLTSLEEPRPYLFRAVLNEARTRGRRQKVGRRVLESVAHGARLWDEMPDVRPEIVQAVGRLPVQQRAATFLVYWHDLSIEEAGRLMGVRPGTVKRYVFLARQTLKGVLDAD